MASSLPNRNTNWNSGHYTVKRHPKDRKEVEKASKMIQR